MRLTTKGRYAVTAMMDLAIHESKGPVTLTEIATSQSISLSYLEQLFANLRRAGLVRGMRGPGGGYRLAMPVEDISVAKIIAAVDEKVDVTCGKGEECKEDASKRCLTHDLWVHLSHQLYDFLDGIKLGDLVTWPCVQETVKQQDERFGRISSVITEPNVAIN